MKDNRLLKVLWGIVLAIFLCSALFLAISYFSGGDNASKKKDNNTTSTSKSKDKEKEDNDDNEDSKSSTSKAKSDEEKYRESQNSNTLTHLQINHLTITQHQIIDVQIIVTITIQAIRKMIKTLSPTTSGTFKTSEEAKKYADAEIARLIKENKKGYSYTLGRNSKGEITVNITEKK